MNFIRRLLGKPAKMKLKTGYDNKGHPYFDLGDKHTAGMFMKDATKFAKVRLCKEKG